MIGIKELVLEASQHNPWLAMVGQAAAGLEPTRFTGSIEEIDPEAAVKVIEAIFMIPVTTGIFSAMSAYSVGGGRREVAIWFRNGFGWGLVFDTIALLQVIGNSR